MSTYTQNSKTTATLTRNSTNAMTLTHAQWAAALRVFERRQQSLWDHPRAPRLEAVADRVVVEFAGEPVADSERALRVVRPKRAPVYFVPPADVRQEYLVPVTAAPVSAVFMPVQYWHVFAGAAVATCAAWSYPEPLPIFDALRDYVAFDADKMDACYVGDRCVLPDGDRVAGGWITFDAQLVASIQACGQLSYW